MLVFVLFVSASITSMAASTASTENSQITGVAAIISDNSSVADSSVESSVGIAKVINTVTDPNDIVNTVAEATAEQNTENIVTIPAVQGTTEAVTCNLDETVNAYNSAQEMPFDYFGKYQTINALWDFLVIQHNMSPEAAAAIIGNVCIEGNFGQEQGSYKIFNSIYTADYRIDAHPGKGYGICQWTTSDRKDILKQYYYNTSLELGSYPWGTQMIVAEMTCMYAEIKAMGIFDSLNSIEDIGKATTYFAKQYEKYGDIGSTNGRIEYACNVYSHYMQ